MSSTTPNPPTRRDIMFCHSCENEWYRDEHGLECPECHSDFTEVVEENNDPREDDLPALEPPHAHPPPHGYYAPDPDISDLDNLQWEETGPGRYRVRGRYTTDIPIGPGQQAPPTQAGLMGLVGNVLQGMLGQQGAGLQQPGQPQQEGPRSPGQTAATPNSPPSDAPPGSPRGNGNFIQHGSGPGFSYTIASSSNSNFGGNLLPRNANAPQPFQHQPDHINNMIGQMIMNMGAMPGGPMGPGFRTGPGGHPFHEHDMHPGFGGPFMMGGGGGPGSPTTIPGMGPFGPLFQLFAPPGGVAGDAVYTQEALDRIMTQLMEQHQAGNAPGPASATAIDSLPKRPVTKEDQGESGKAECSICMDEVELGKEVTVLPCEHWFHHECIKAWLSEHDTCPHCRQGIMPKEGEAQRSGGPRSPSQAPLNDMRSPEYTRPAGIPGAFPFPAQSGQGTAQSPFVVPDSPGAQRRSSAGERRTSSSGGGGVFSRMRDAFGRGSGSAGPSGGDGSGRG